MSGEGPKGRTPREYRASELGGCERAQIAKQLEYMAINPPQQMMDVFAAGEKAEHRAISELIKRGWLITGQQMELREDISSQFCLTGHIDGIGGRWGDDGKGNRVAGPDHVIEIKSMSSAIFGSWLRTKWDTEGLVQKYKWQVSAYMNMLSMPCLFVVINRDVKDAVILDIEYVQTPFYSMGDIKAKIVRMEAKVRDGELPHDCDVDNGWACPFRYLHTVEYELSDDDDLAEIAILYKRALGRKRVVEEEVRELRRKLDENTKCESFHHAKVDVTYYESKNPPRWDEAKLREDGINPDEYKTQTKGTRCRVTLRGDDESRGD